MKTDRPAASIAAVLLSSFLFLAPPVFAQQDLAARVADHLQAGEFGPARKLAEQANDAAARDRLLGDVAQAQAQGGARNAALDTLASMADDRYRGRAAEQISTQPIGGWGAGGGASMADFDTLIDLITSTIAPQTWDAVGGPGSIEGFPTGVYVDARGLMRRIDTDKNAADLAVLRNAALPPQAARPGNRDVRAKSVLRKVSLTRLEKQVQLRWAAGKRPDDAMLALAGIQKIQYVFVYPETGDLVIAGPAEGWRTGDEGRTVGIESGQPTLNLDDFVVVLRNAYEQGGAFTCSITPKRENLAATQAFLTESSKQPLKPGESNRWVRQIRDRMGTQLIEVKGIDPRTRAARVIVEADYRMKLVGMGLEEVVFGVKSYLETVPAPKAGEATPMSVLRWWFTMNYEAIRATPDHAAFELRGQGVQVQSENEMLTARGDRVHTGQSDELNREFAHSFTKHFPALAKKYPIYAELRNVFDLALVAALIRAQDLAGQTNWHMAHFASPDRYAVSQLLAPAEVETVANHRVIGQKHIVAGVSGGVSVLTQPLVAADAIETDDYGALKAEHRGAKPANLPETAWWWD